MGRFMIMNENDMAATALEHTGRGEQALIYSQQNRLLFELRAEEEIPFGNKIALTDIPEGERVIKYGAPIGMATRDIKKGTLVHVHNVKSLAVDIPENIRREIIRQMNILAPSSEIPAPLGEITALSGTCCPRRKPVYEPASGDRCAAVSQPHFQWGNPDTDGTPDAMEFMGYARPDGSVGIRNKILIIAVDECCEGIARGIARHSAAAVVLTNWYTCMLGGNEETFNQMVAVGKNPNVAAVMVIAMGCGSILPSQVGDEIALTGKPVVCMTCEQLRGTRNTIAYGVERLKEFEAEISSMKREKFPMSKLVVGVKCGGSDTSSGIASNPSAGAALDRLTDMGAVGIGGELFELQGCEEILSERAVSPEVAQKIITLIGRERDRWSVKGADVETMSIGNCVGGLTTIEEKSLGALHKMGSRPIQDVLQINKDFIDRPDRPGFYLSEATMLCGGAGVNYASLGAHMILWTSGAAGFQNALVPVILISGNSELINDDIDIDASAVMDGTAGVEDIARQIVDTVRRVADGEPARIEGIGDSTMTLYQKDQRVESLLAACKRS